MANVKPGNEHTFNGKTIRSYIMKVNSDISYIPVIISSTSNEDEAKKAKPSAASKKEEKKEPTQEVEPKTTQIVTSDKPSEGDADDQQPAEMVKLIKELRNWQSTLKIAIESSSSKQDSEVQIAVAGGNINAI